MEHDAVRRSYDQVAEEYLSHIGDELAHKPLDRALLSALIEQTPAGTPIADLGCGPGHVTAWLAGHGATAVGIDLSAGMVALARRAFPHIEFRDGDLLALPAADGSFGSVIALYSVIHLAPAELAPAFVEMHRVLRPAGLALIAFHIGTEVRHRDEWWGHDIDLDFRFLEPSVVVSTLQRTGFVVEAQLDRQSYATEVETRRCYLLARRR